MDDEDDEFYAPEGHVAVKSEDATYNPAHTNGDSAVKDEDMEAEDDDNEEAEEEDDDDDDDDSVRWSPNISQTIPGADRRPRTSTSSLSAKTALCPSHHRTSLNALPLFSCPFASSHAKTS